MLQPRWMLGIALAYALGASISAGSAAAQSSGKIAGTVRVASGAPVDAVAVTITRQADNVTRVARTTANGTYEAADLAPGVYTVTVDVHGFRRATKAGVNVAAGATETVDFALDVKLSAEVTVTAMKREDTILTTPVSVAAPTEEVLRERGVETIEEVAANVAGFSVQNLGPGQSQVAIRGISSGQIARDQPGVKEQVGAYLDESVISMSLFTPDIDLFDVERVEVLRGPQGTLFGSGSLAGTVRYISNQPQLGQTKVFGEVTGTTLSNGGAGGNAKIGFNVPLGDSAALRFAGYYDRFPGYQDAVQPDLSVKEDLNTGDRAGFRASLQIAPTDALTIVPRVLYQRVTMDGWNRTDVFNILANPYTTTRPKVTLGGRRLFTQIEEPFTDKFFLGDLAVRYQLGDVTLASITSFTRRDILVVRDAGALTSSITGGSIGLPANVYTLDSPLDDATEAKQFTQELRATGGKERFSWVAGVFYAKGDRDYGQNLLVAGFEDLTDVPTRGLRAPKDSLYFSDLHYELKQFALFGEATVKVTDALTATAGLRYYDFDEDKDQIFDGIFANDNTGTSLVSQPGTTKADGFAPRLILSYKVSPDTTLNAQVARGFRLGGINDPINIPLCTPQDLITFGGRESWGDETAWNYEIGSKSRLFGGRGSLGVSAFYVDITDLQVTVTAGSCSSRLVFNVPKARSIGADLEFGITPNEHFDIALAVGYNDATLRSTLTSTDLSGNVTVVSGIEAGRRLPSTPKLNAAASVTYQTFFGGTYTGYVNGSYQHVGARYTQVGDEDLGVLDLTSFGANTIGGPLTQSTFTFNPELPAYDLLNARIGVKHDFWDVSLFVKNLTDERALLALDRERGLRARVGYLVNQPRTFGVTARFDF